eukprot:5458656-Lingulodinium_polyedra.AAC.1
MLPILGIQTPFQVVEGYSGNTLLGEPFVSYPGVLISANELSVTGVGAVPLDHFKIPLSSIVPGMDAVIKAVNTQYAPGEIPDLD